MNERTVARLQKAPVPAQTVASMHPNLLQYKCACGQHTIAGGECEECRQKREGVIQRAAVSAAPVNTVPSIVHEVLSSPGQTLDAGTRAFKAVPNDLKKDNPELYNWFSKYGELNPLKKGKQEQSKKGARTP